jgi:hypothetical protein
MMTGWVAEVSKELPQYDSSFDVLLGLVENVLDAT